MSENQMPKPVLPRVKQNVLVLTRDETRSLLVAMCKPPGVIDVVVFYSSPDFALSVIEAFKDAAPEWIYRGASERCQLKRGTSDVLLLPGDPRSRICGRRHPLVIIVSDDGYNEELVRELFWHASV